MSIQNTDISTNDEYVINNPPYNKMIKNVCAKNSPIIVSFCIPTYNNEDTLEACISSIKRQDYPFIEIIIIDGGSKDRTIEIANKYSVKILRDTGTYGSAIKTGIENSKGEILALFDSDIIFPHEQWISNAVKYFDYNEKVSTVWPLNIPKPDGNMTQKLYLNHWKIIIDDRIINNRGIAGGGNSLFLRKCIDSVGGINGNIHWGADFDWAKRLKDAGYSVVYITDPIIHDTMRSFSKYAKKQFVGAKTFTETGFEIMGLSLMDVIREQYVLGFLGMIKGLFKDNNSSWLIYPIYIATRNISYSYTYAIKIWKKLY